MFEQVLDHLLAPAGVGERELELAMGRLVSSQIDFGELYFQQRTSEGWVLEDGAVKSGSYNSDLGVGDRKSTRLNSSHVAISYAVFGLKHTTGWNTARSCSGT